MKKGCLYWLILGWWLEPILYLIRQTRIVVWIAAIAVLIGFLIMAGAFLVAMAFVFAVLAVLIIIASGIIGLIRKIYSRRNHGADMEDLHVEEIEEPEEQYQPDPVKEKYGSEPMTVCIPQPETVPEEIVNPAAIKKSEPAPVKKPEMSDEQALRYGLICNAYLDHQEEMEQYEPNERNNEKGNIQDDL